MKFKEANVINAYACTYNQRSEWIYKTKTNCSGYFIRKKNWKSLFKRHYKIVDELLFQIDVIYDKYIYKPLKRARQKEIAKYEQRADYQSIEKMVVKHDDARKIEGLISFRDGESDNTKTKANHYFGIEAELNQITYTEIKNEMDIHERKFK